MDYQFWSFVLNLYVAIGFTLTELLILYFVVKRVAPFAAIADPDDVPLLKSATKRAADAERALLEREGRYGKQ